MTPRRFVPLVLALLPFSSAPAPAASPDAGAAATRAARQLSSGDFESLVASFAPRMKAAVTKEQLAGVWTSVGGQVGALQRIGEPVATAAGPFTEAELLLQFERGVLKLKATVNAEGLLEGLLLLPADAPAAPPDAGEPPYAKPGDFREEDVTIGAGEWALPGTLTRPTGSAAAATTCLPAVVLVHGSGPHDRDETIGPNKPFRDLAHGLASAGVVVLRYDKRSKVHGARMVALPVTPEAEVIDDAVSAARVLFGTTGVDPARVFVLGHSLGGTLAPRIARAEPRIAGLVILAGAARPLQVLVREQTDYLASLPGRGEETRQAAVKVRAEIDGLERFIRGEAPEPAGFVLGAPASYWADLAKHRPADEAAALGRPVLALQGGRDYQVTAADFALWKAALSGRKRSRTVSFPALNHLFMGGQGKSTPEEYGAPGHVDGVVVETIVAFLRDAPPETGAR